MADNEHSSPDLTKIAAKRLHDPDPEVRALAGSVLTQSPDHQEPVAYVEGGSDGAASVGD